MLQSGMNGLVNSRIPAMVLVWLTLLVPAFGGDNNTDRGALTLPHQTQSPLPDYKIQAGMEGEIYPVFANYGSLQKQTERTFGAVSVTVSNLGDSFLRQRVAVKIVVWSDEEIQIAELAPAAAHPYLFAPDYLPRFSKNHQMCAAA